MKKVLVYIHGKGGNAIEAEHYKPLFRDYDVIGFDYKANTPWEAKMEFGTYFDIICSKYDSVAVVANSIGAFFSLNTLSNHKISKAFFISPIVNMEKLIANMMTWANVKEEDLEKQKEISTAFGETLSWEYLCYVREHPIVWNIPTHILYGSKDHLTSYETIVQFTNQIRATLAVMENGEHWFHTKEQMDYLDSWLLDVI